MKFSLGLSWMSSQINTCFINIRALTYRNCGIKFVSLYDIQTSSETLLPDVPESIWHLIGIASELNVSVQK